MIERIKAIWKKRIERNAFKSTLTWKDKKKKEHTEIVYFKRSQIPFVDIGDWARIYPPINEDNKISWVNFIVGGKKNLIKLIIVGLVVAITLLGFQELFNHINYLEGICTQDIILP